MEPRTVTLKLCTIIPKRSRTFSEILINQAKQFCLSTALHGYRFIVLPKRILLERVVWAIICLVALITAISLLCVAWLSFEENPTLVVTDSTHYPIWNYAFPAVTICDFNQISKAKVFELAKNLSVSDGRSVEELIWDLRLLFQLINNNDLNLPSKNYTRLQDILAKNNISASNALQKITPSCEDKFQRCKWKGEEKRCESIFEPIKSSEGFCCSFNYLALKNHTFSGILANRIPKKPRRMSSCGYQTGLELLLNNDPNDYFASHIASVGHRVIIHNSYYFPDWTLQTLLSQKKKLDLISVTPTITYSTEAIREMDIQTRKCLFPNEMSLIYLEQYSFHNCMVECRMNLTIKLCGCTPYYYIHERGVDQGICTTEDLSCLAENEHLITSSVPGVDFSSFGPNHEYGSEKNECGCLPDCESTDYLSESSSGVVNGEYSTNQILKTGSPIYNQSILRVFFSDLVAIRNRRDVLFNWHTLLAYYGGILGLVIGFSFVSGMELIYFFTMKLFAEIKNNKTKDNIIWEPKKLQKHRNPKEKMQTTVYENLDPKKLIIPTETEVRRRSNSNPYFYLD